MYFVVNNAMGLKVGIWKCTLHSSSLQLRMHSPVFKGEICPHTIGGRPVDYDLQWVCNGVQYAAASHSEMRSMYPPFTASVSHIACIQSHSRSTFSISRGGSVYRFQADILTLPQLVARHFAFAYRCHMHVAFRHQTTAESAGIITLFCLIRSRRVLQEFFSKSVYKTVAVNSKQISSAGVWDSLIWK